MMTQIVTGNESLSAFASSKDVHKIPVPTRIYTENTVASVSDVGCLVCMSSAGAITYTLLADGGEPFFTDQRLSVCWYGAGSTSIVPASGVTINGSASTVTLSARYSCITLEKIGPNAWMRISENSSGAGSGDVTGPANSVDARIAIFSGTSGKILADGGSTISEAIASAVSAASTVKFTWNTGGSSDSLLHLPSLGHAVGDTFDAHYFNPTLDNASGGKWRIISAANAGVPLGTILYRTVVGTSTYPVTVSGATHLDSDLGFVAGDTIVINGNTLTFVASGASGNNQINVTDRYKTLQNKLAAMLSSDLGADTSVDVLGNRPYVGSSQFGGLISTANFTISGAGAAKLGFAAATYPFVNALTIDGQNWRFQLVPGRGGVIDIRSLGMVCDDATVVDYRVLRRVIAASAAEGYFLCNNAGARNNATASGRLRVSRTIDFRRCSCDLRLQFGTAETGDYFNEAAHITYLAARATWIGAGSNPDTEPSNPNTSIDAYSYVDFGGTTRYRGICIYGAGDASNSLSCRQTFDIRGDGNFDFSTPGTTAAVYLSNDNACNGTYQVIGSYHGIITVIKDNLEKCDITVRATYSDLPVYVDSTGANSPDTLRIKLLGQDNRHFVWEEDGSDTSCWYDLTMESRAAPAVSGSPAVYIRNGKFSRLSGQLRATNGSRQILVDKTSNVGVDSFQCDITGIHGVGTFLEVRRCRNVFGNFAVKNWNTTATAAPLIWLKRIGCAGGLRGTLLATTAREAIRIGDIATDVHANGLYGIDCDYGTYAIQSGVSNFPFASDGSESVTPFPTSSPGLVVEKAKGGSISFTQCVGNIEVRPACTASTSSGKFVIRVPRTFAANTGSGKSFTALVSTSAQVDFICVDGDIVSQTAF